MANLTLSDEKKEEIQGFLIERFDYLHTQRQQLDEEVVKEAEIYNNIDADIRSKEEHDEKYEVPYVYTIVQTMTARVIESLFGHNNYVKLFVEEKPFIDIEKQLNLWIQGVLDKIGLKHRARDMIEEALTKRTAWILLRPVDLDKDGRKHLKIDYDIHDFFDVWCDLKARRVEDTDFFVRKIKKLWEVKGRPDVYFNLDEVTHYIVEESDDGYVKDDLAAKLSSSDNIPQYSEFSSRNNVTDEVEILEYYGLYDLGEGDIDDPDYKPDVQEVIFTLANRRYLIRAEKNTLPTRRKRLIFPIRPLRQANSLYGKGVGQLIRNLAHESNETRSLRMQNFKLLIELLFRYDKNGGVDPAELFAAGGNAIGYEGVQNKDAVDTFDVPNLVREASLMVSEGVQEMQQVTGAVDHLMGTTAARGVSETAAGTRQITENATFKMSMAAENIALDLIEFINYIAILYLTYNPNEIVIRYPELAEFANSLPEDIEDGYIFDINLKDISQRRDVERNQWANAIGVIGPMVMQTGGNMQELLKQFMNIFEIPNQDLILQEESPQALAAKLLNNPQLYAAVMQLIEAQIAQQQTQGGAAGQAPAPAVPGGDALERAANENIGGAG